MRPHEEDSTGAQTHTHSAPAQRQVVAMWPGGSVTRELPPGGRLTIGRSTRCDVAVDHPSVSREHAVFHGGPPLAIEDLGSTNGTGINGVRAARGPRALEGGEVITIGAAVLVVCGAPLDDAAGPKGDGGASRARGAGPVVVDPAMKEVHRIAELVAKGPLSVILLGETGAGKEIVAGAIHRASPRARSAFVRVNCAALPEPLLESELFGHERGAFTGATQTKPGLLESAHGGTVFLDEIGELPLAMQAKLLCVLETREVTRVGALRPRLVDVRFVAATNRDLAALVRDGGFRQDLYFRLNGITLTVPPLRSRTTEIAPLANAFVAAACRDAGRPELPLADDALARLRSHPWPGNVRELRNVIQRAVALCTGDRIEAAHLALEAPLPEAPPTARSGLPTIPAPPLRDEARGAASAVERQRIADAIERCGGNQTRAAKMLGISRRTLVTRLTEYGFARPLKGASEEE
jgi:DNA-binding NtrC family response regulator